MSAQGAGMISSFETRRVSSPKKLSLDYDGHNLVFVVGCPRSGTTWAQRLLASHPKIRTGQESNLFSDYVGCQLRHWREDEDAQVRGGLGLPCYFTEEEFLRTLKSYLLVLLEPMIAGLAPDELFLEKSPPHALFLPEIFELLPRARVIHVLRDARDVASSVLAAGEDWLSPWTGRAAEAAHNWARYVQAVRDALPKLPPKQFHEIRYENLSQSPVEVLQGCADFLGLEWDSAEIAKAVDANQAAKARVSGGTPIPLYGEVAKRSGSVVLEPKGFIRKAQPGAWKNDLSLSEKFRVWRAAHELMNEVGYHWPKAMALAFGSLSTSMHLAKLALSPGRRRIRKRRKK
jgi:hypothetical protein